MDNLQIIRGYPFPGTPWFLKKNIEGALDYMPRDGDVIIASFPKSGTHWITYIVLQIVSRGELFPSIDETIGKIAPFLELSGVETVERMEWPRIFKYHFPYNMVQKNEKAKYLYIYRNPVDTFVSYHHHLEESTEQRIDIDRFLENYLAGNVGYGRVFDHILSYFSHKKDENMLLVSYEKLQANRKAEILRIAKYLGENYFRDLSNDAILLDRIIEHTSFDYMKKHLYLTHPKEGAFRIKPEERSSGNPPKRMDFFRKGVSGDGKKILSQDQLKKIREAIAESMKDTELINEWLKE